MNQSLDVVSVIQDKWNAKSTGALFLLGRGDSLVQVYFVQGEIVALKSGHLRGEDLIDKIASLKLSKSQFYDQAETKVNDDLPSMEKIMAMLSAAKNEIGQDGILSVNAESKAQDIFTGYVGPIADIIFHDLLSESESVDELTNSLAVYIKNNDDKNAFIAEMEYLKGE